MDLLKVVRNFCVGVSEISTVEFSGASEWRIGSEESIGSEADRCEVSKNMHFSCMFFWKDRLKSKDFVPRDPLISQLLLPNSELDVLVWIVKRLNLSLFHWSAKNCGANS